MKSLLISSILILLISFSNQTCIPGENCPYNQGECQDDQCICKDGFFTLIDSSKSEIDQVFCDYGQISIKLMLLFEVVLPSAGQFYAKRWIHGIVKFVIVACFLITSLFITKKCLIPKCYIVIKNAFLGGDDDKKKDKDKDKDDKNGTDKEDNDDGKDDNKHDADDENLVSDCMQLQSVKELGFGGSRESCLSNFKYYFSRASIYLFWTVYSLDIYLIFFQLYDDGEGIPFGD